MAAQVRAGHEALEALAITDGLTGLYNRRHFEDVLVREMRRAEREKAPLSLAMIDLDHFKEYNDRWGHREGDAELARVALRVKQAVRTTDEAFRYGGEELAVLLPGCPRAEAVAVAEKIRFAINADAAHLGGRGTTASLGVATAPDDAGISARAGRGRRPRSLRGEGPRPRPGGAGRRRGRGAAPGRPRTPPW